MGLSVSQDLMWVVRNVSVGSDPRAETERSVENN